MTDTDGATVLVVDDDDPVRELTAVILRGAGYEITEAADGAQAIESLGRQRPALLVLDILMPGVDGWGVLQHVRTMPSPPRIVVATGTHELVPPGQLGPLIAGYLIKPFAVDQLLKTCRTALSAPPVVPAEGSRREARRTFIAEIVLLGEQDQPLARGYLTQLSRSGFRIELAFPFRSGDSVRIGFLVPGRVDPLRLRGRVRWQSEVMLGAEIVDVDPDDDEYLRRLLQE
jgi:CheY-like chemotaxis protein